MVALIWKFLCHLGAHIRTLVKMPLMAAVLVDEEVSNALESSQHFPRSSETSDL